MSENAYNILSMICMTLTGMSFCVVIVFYMLFRDEKKHKDESYEQSRTVTTQLVALMESGIKVKKGKFITTPIDEMIRVKK